MSTDNEHSRDSNEVVTAGLQMAIDLLADEYRKRSDHYPYGMTGVNGADIEQMLIKYINAISAVGAVAAEIQRMKEYLKSENEAFRKMYRDAQEASDRHRSERDSLASELEKIKRDGLGTKGSAA
jgi:hypothetical protein